MYLYRARIVCHWIIYSYMYAPMIRSFVYRELVSCIVHSFRVSCIRFVYRAFASCIVRLFRVSCVFRIVRVKRLFVFRSPRLRFPFVCVSFVLQIYTVQDLYLFFAWENIHLNVSYQFGMILVFSSRRGQWALPIIYCPCLNSRHILASTIYFDSNMFNSKTTVVHSE